jgi:hypothetical protein
MLNRFPFVLCSAILTTALTVLPATAQIRSAGSGTAGFGISVGSAGASGMGSSRMAMSQGAGFAGFHQGRGFGHNSVLLSYPYFHPDSDGSNGSEQVVQPQVIVVPASAPAPPEAPPAARESLLIEWQGDHFVRTTMSGRAPAGEPIAPDYAERPASPLSAAGRVAAPKKETVQPPRELPPAVLVFHNGRKEEVTEYTIMNGTIYSKADYWSTGSWTRKIQIADLDVPATLKFNQEHGVKFALPASPNEIVIRP